LGDVHFAKEEKRLRYEYLKERLSAALDERRRGEDQKSDRTGLAEERA